MAGMEADGVAVGVEDEGEDADVAVVGFQGNGVAGGASLFDGETEAAIFPGDLPENPDMAKHGAGSPVRFVRFRPPLVPRGNQVGLGPSFPHIRLDRALEFLLGDRLA